MSQGDKSALYKALTSAGWKPEKHYRDYSTSDLEAIANQMLGEAARTKQADPEPAGPVRQAPQQGRREQPKAAPVIWRWSAWLVAPAPASARAAC